MHEENKYRKIAGEVNKTSRSADKTGFEIQKKTIGRIKSGDSEAAEGARRILYQPSAKLPIHYSKPLHISRSCRGCRWSRLIRSHSFFLLD